jgi:hypothetical protein
MNKRIAFVSTIFALLVFASVMSSKKIPTVHAASCFAICAHESHGSVGWSGPIRTGSNGSADAQKDADAHNKANPGHSASTSCN